jgi:hypothetical protein
MYYHFMYAHAFGSGRDTTSMCTLVCLWLQRVAALLPTKAPNVCYDAGSCHQEHSTCSTQSVLRPHPYGLHPACSRSQAAETGATVLCQHQARTPRSFSLFSQQIPQTNHPSCSRSQAAVTAATVPCQHQARTPRSFSLFHQQYLKPTTHRETERVSVFFEIKISNPPSSSSTEQRQSCSCSQAAVTAATVPCQHQARTPRSFSLFHQQYLKLTTQALSAHTYLWMMAVKTPIWRQFKSKQWVASLDVALQRHWNRTRVVRTTVPLCQPDKPISSCKVTCATEC